MNKKLLAMAVAAAITAPMMAQAAPTLYGHLQVEVASKDDGNKNQSNANTGAAGSEAMATDDNKRGRLGVKGSEDLGNGMSALYNFEWQVETTQGQVNDGTRVGMVGLKGGFGTIMAGALKTPYKYYGGVKYDPFVTTYMEARSRGGMSGKMADADGASKGSFGHHGFMTDAIGYKNKFGAVELWANISLDENGGAKGKDGDMNIGVKFSGGNYEAFFAMASDDQSKSTSTSSTSTADLVTGVVTTSTVTTTELGTYDATKFGGMYKMGAHKIKLQIETTEAAEKSSFDGTTLTTSTGSWDGDHMFIGYEMKMGKNVIAVNYGASEYTFTPGTSKTTVDYLAVGVFHKMSKKTQAFVGHSTSEQKDTGSDAVEESVTSLGLRVTF